MPIIKLDAIDSTNDYLKQLSKESDLENYTIVMADEQTKGKGQMGAKWVSEKGKNLTVSILVKDIALKNELMFDLNIAVALSVLKVLKNINIPNISIKWPNDIMSDAKKVAGILIENRRKPDGSFTSVVGIGLNLNQTNFENLPQATSLRCITGEVYEPEAIAILITEKLKEYVKVLAQNPEFLWETYHQHLFKINYPSAFEDKMGNRFMGIIKKVTSDGKLEVLSDDDNIGHYEVKEIKMLY
ncbi:biotin--[acetyl-CoA-carboxylase] ligase [Flavobacterium wongokense]|uniref:biotin--[acetyl-CoA-carboxylase] ligase n=1 Tax=Flavobacterium wongokense TaxID=2910674 RepID=UPI001F42AFA6|nr:biotin--[acetyl-CoA-carboxylase] ligase [Flavobacterium sp. WG47]MCF6132839.1 biotin--[acetyl-CoA-carboxylase] ligase [Flavobacterium sp. WG47]